MCRKNQNLKKRFDSCAGSSGDNKTKSPGWHCLIQKKIELKKGIQRKYNIFLLNFFFHMTECRLVFMRQVTENFMENLPFE